MSDFDTGYREGVAEGVEELEIWKSRALKYEQALREVDAWLKSHWNDDGPDSGEVLSRLETIVCAALETNDSRDKG